MENQIKVHRGKEIETISVDQLTSTVLKAYEKKEAIKAMFKGEVVGRVWKSGKGNEYKDWNYLVKTM